MGAPVVHRSLDRLRQRNPWSDTELWRRGRTARMYGLGLAARRVRPDSRFVILTTGRTGSELLVDLLGSRPDVVCDGEILQAPPAWPFLFLAGRSAVAALRGARAYGFKVNRTHFGYRPVERHDQLLHRLADDGFHLVHLRRGDALGQALSAASAAETQWHWRAEDDRPYAPPRVDPHRIVGLLSVLEHSERSLEVAIGSRPHLRLTYEDDLIDGTAQQAAVDRICARLGLPSRPVRSDIVRRTPPRREDRVANFPEVADVVSRTRFRHHLDHVSA